MNANEIADLMEEVADGLLFVHRTKGSIVSGARLYEFLTSLSTILDWSRFTMPNIADSVEEIRADIKDVANGCMGGESLPRAEMRPGGLMLPRCAKRLRDMATKTRDEPESGQKQVQDGTEDEKPVRISVAEKSVKVSVSAIKQAVKRGEITSYRKKGAKKNSPHLVLVSEVVEHFSEHGEK